VREILKMFLGGERSMVRDVENLQEQEDDHVVLA